MPLLTEKEIAELDRVPDELTPENTPTQNIRFAAQGGLLGGAEEAEAFLMNPLSATGLLGTSPEAYEDYLADVRQKLAAAREVYPVQSTAAEIAGGVASSVPLMMSGAGGPAAAANVGRIAGLAGRLGKPALGGAALGGAYEFGTGEGGFQERLRGVPEAALAGAVLAPVLGETVGLAGRGLVGLVDFTKRKFGGRAATAVDQEFQKIAQEAGINVDEAIERVANGEIIADLSATAQATLRSYKTQISDQMDKRIRERPAELRARAMGAVQRTLSPNSDENVIRQFEKGVEASKREASEAYDEIYKTAGKLNPRVMDDVQESISFAPEAAKEINTLIRLQGGGKAPPLVEIVDGVARLTRIPNLKELEAVRQGFSQLAQDSKGAIRIEYNKLQNKIRAIVDEASPELRATRAKWASIEQGAEAFQRGSKVFTKSSDEIEIAFEEVSEMGGDALSAFRAGLMDAIRSKMGKARGPTSLPRLITDMEKKEAKIFETIFPGDTYEETFRALDRAARSQETKSKVIGGSDTFESLTLASRQGRGTTLANITDAAGVKLGSGIAAARLLNRLLGSVSETLSDAQKRQVAQLLMEENPDVVARALKDSAGYDELARLAEALSKRIRAAGQVGAAQAGSGLTEDFTGLLGN
tara:strand:+ start:4478 stop:6409 length:1932 start_codon:yes stop_codon:yes gene_type:complete